jgi:hypothetical protein
MVLVMMELLIMERSMAMEHSSKQIVVNILDSLITINYKESVAFNRKMVISTKENGIKTPCMEKVCSNMHLETTTKAYL